MAISDSLVTAHRNLQRAIPEPPTPEEERQGKNAPHVEPAALYEAARRFVEALSRRPVTAAELKRRGELLAESTGEGGEYLTEKRTGREALREWNADGVFLKKLVRSFQHTGPRELVGDVRHEASRLEQLLAYPDVPDEVRHSLETWREVADRIATAGENDSLDGCYWLLHLDQLKSTIVAAGAAQDVRAAADALVEWCKAQPTKRMCPKAEAGQGRHMTGTTAKRKRMNTSERDEKFAREYDKLVEDSSGKVTSITDFAKKKRMKRPAMSKAIKRGRALLAKEAKGTLKKNRKA